MPKILTRVDAGETYCEVFGHRWMLMKCYGQTYMECEVCKRVRQINEQDALTDALFQTKEQRDAL